MYLGKGKDHNKTIHCQLKLNRQVTGLQTNTLSLLLLFVYRGLVTKAETLNLKRGGANVAETSFIA